MVRARLTSLRVTVFVLVVCAAPLGAQTREFDESIEYTYVGSVKDVQALPNGVTAVRCMNATDEMLKALAACSRIEQLDLYSNERITDEGVAILAALKNLRHLNLGYSPHLTKESIRSLAPLKNLTELDLSGLDHVADFRPVGQLKSLTDLRLHGGLTGITTSATRYMRTLQYLSLGGYFDIGDEFEGWDKLESLNTLDLGGSEICDEALLSLKNTKVRKLNLSLCRGFSNDALAELIAADFLESLSLQMIVTVDDSIIKAIGKATKLRELTLTIDGRVSDMAFEAWTDKLALESLWIRADFKDILKKATYEGPAKLGPAFSKALGRLPKLAKCVISGFDVLTDEDALRFIKPTLRSLTIARCSLLTSKSLEPLRNSAIEKLDLHRLDTVSDKTLADLISSLDSLSELQITDCGDAGSLLIRAIAGRKIGLKGFTFNSAQPLGKEEFSALGKCTSLQELTLLSGAGVNDDALAALSNLNALKVLKVTGSQIGPKGLAEISKMDQLTYLDLSNCKGIGTEDLVSLKSSSLHLLSLYGCPSVSAQAIEAWRKENPRCKVLH
jgi:Leucine-rich repeat (LRR) protein